jgi:type IV pilus assembly protein PilQ
MKINRSLMEILILVGLFIWIGSASALEGAPSGPVAAETAKAMEAESGYLENITFEKLKGKERVVLMLSRQSGASVEDRGGMIVTVKLENLYVPQNLRRAIGEGSLDNLIRVVPIQRNVGGRPQALIGMEMSKRVPYSVRQEGHHVIVDYNVSILPTATIAGNNPAPQQQAALKTAAPEEKTPVQKPTVQPNAVPPSYKSSAIAGRLVSLDFQEASIKSVLQLLAEEGGVSIISGDDVKGNITVSMKKVPWEQALDSILGISGLGKKQMGDVISVMTLEKMKKEEAERRAGEADRAAAELIAKKSEQERLVEGGKLRQISIEAKIVEASDEFVRNLGVQWGGGSYGTVGSGTGFALIGGSNAATTRPMTWGYPNEVPFRTTTDSAIIQSAAVNYPTALAGPTLGLIIGGASAVLEAQISALETNSQGKVISSPKVTTMDGVKARIEQGDEIPYTTRDAQGTPTVSWKKATLSLSVTPKITPDGRISMDVTATNDTPQYDRAAALQGNIPIRKSEVTSTVVVKNGETLVIGGILKTEDTKGDIGVPWISKIPVLGWLFKTESTIKNRRQLMIFVTPKIMKPDVVGESSVLPRG